MNLTAWVTSLALCVLAVGIGAVLGAVVGVAFAGALLPPEEAVALVAGVGYGAPLGAALGLTVGVVALVRRLRRGG